MQNPFGRKEQLVSTSSTNHAPPSEEFKPGLALAFFAPESQSTLKRA